MTQPSQPSLKRSGTGRPKAWHWMLLVILLVGFNLVRSPYRLILPTLRVEDGTDVFAYFYQNRGVEEIFRFKAGYIPLIANIVGYCSVRLPTRLTPYGLTWMPLALSVAAFSIIFSRSYETWIPSPILRGAISMLFALSPLANTNLRAHTDYSIWTTLFMLILITARPLPRTPLPKTLAWLGINLLVWSHPLTITVLPVILLFFWRQNRDRALYALTALNLVIHQVIGVETPGIFSGMALTRVLTKLGEPIRGTSLVVAKTGFAAAFGMDLLEEVNQAMPTVLVVWIALVVLASVYTYRQTPRARDPILLSVYYIGVLTFLSILGRGYDTAGLIAGGKRYIHIQGLLFLLLYGLLAYHLGAGLLDLWKCWRKDEMPALLRQAVLVIPVAVLICHHLVLGCNVGDPPSHAIENGLIVRRFFDELAELEKSRGSHKGIHLVADKQDDWPIVVDTR